MHRTTRTIGRRRRAACVLSASILAAGCGNTTDQPETVGGDPPGALASAVVGRAASAITPEGTLRLPARALSAREITDLRAGELARAYASTFGPFLIEELELQHGGRIEVASLRPCGRALYARTSYERMPEVIDRPTRSGFGSWWVVTLCDRGAPAVVVAVSALAADVSADVSGALTYSGSSSGNEFVMRGARVERPYGPLATPEDAVVKASQLTGRRVSELPDLVAPSFGRGGGLGAVWRIKLETSTRFRRADRSAAAELVTDEIGIRSGKNDTVLVADVSQPNSQSFYQPIGSGENVTFRQTSVSRDPTAPVSFVTVVPTETP